MSTALERDALAYDESIHFARFSGLDWLPPALAGGLVQAFDF
jgi:hypothetical protein